MNCGSYEDWKEKNTNKKTGNTNKEPISWDNSGKEGGQMAEMAECKKDI